MTALFVLHFFVAGTSADDGDDSGWGHLAGGGLFSFGNIAYYSRRASAPATCEVTMPIQTNKYGQNVTSVDWDDVCSRAYNHVLSWSCTLYPHNPLTQHILVVYFIVVLQRFAGSLGIRGFVLFRFDGGFWR
jgi:hypothetical protein